MTTLTQVTVKKNFLQTVRDLAETEDRVYVRSKSGVLYMTLDPVKRHMATPAVPVTAQRFKDHFSRFSSLIHSGMAFELSIRGSNRVVYARQHTSYEDPLEDVIDTWQKMIVAEAVNSGPSKALLAGLKGLEAVSKEDRAQTKADLEKIILGIARLSIGHAPFQEGPSKGFPRVVDAAA